MDQPQTPGDLVNHPESDNSKKVVVLREKLTGEGLDESVISMKLKKAEEALTIAACLLNLDCEDSSYWDDSDEYLEILRGNFPRSSTDFSIHSPVSYAVCRAHNAILDAEEACTTDTHRAELVRLKKRLLGNDVETLDEGDPKCALKDKIYFLKEEMVRDGVVLSEIAARMKVSEAEDAVDSACSLLMLIGEEKREFRCDLGGEDSTGLIERMAHRMRLLEHNEHGIVSCMESAKEAILRAKEACNYEKGDDLSSYVPIDRISLLEAKLFRDGVDKSEIAARVKKANEAVERMFDICVFTDREKEVFMYDTHGHNTGFLRRGAVRRVLKKGEIKDVNTDERVRMVNDAIRDAERACHYKEGKAALYRLAREIMKKKKMEDLARRRD